MKTINYKITDNAGLHARPAGLLSKNAAKFKSKTTIIFNEKEVEASRLFGIIGLGVKMGDVITITFDGEDEEEAALEMKKFLSENL